MDNHPYQLEQRVVDVMENGGTCDFLKDTPSFEFGGGLEFMCVQFGCDLCEKQISENFVKSGKARIKCETCNRQFDVCEGCRAAKVHPSGKYCPDHADNFSDAEKRMRKMFPELFPNKSNA